MTDNADTLRRNPRLPRGVNRLPRDEVLRVQRERLIEGMGRAVSQRGYADTAVSHVLAEAGVSRAAFYTLFKDKEDCFLQGFQMLSERHLRHVEEAMQREANLPGQLQAALHAYLAVLDLDEHLARAFVVEAEAASPAIRAAFLAVGDRLERMIGDWHGRVRAAWPEVPVRSAMVLHALREGLAGIVIGRVQAGGGAVTTELRQVVTLVHAALGLYRWAALCEQGEPVSGAPC